jgi:hypothetical protein
MRVRPTTDQRYRVGALEDGRGWRESFSKQNKTHTTGETNQLTLFDGCIGTSSHNKKMPSPREASLRAPVDFAEVNFTSGEA